MVASTANRRIAAMNHYISRLPIVALSVALLAPFAAGAQEPPPGAPQERGMHERDMKLHHGEGDMMPPFLRGIDLSKEQKDKLAAVMQTQAPQLREQHRAVADAHRALHELALSAAFDDAKAAALAQTLGQALAKAALQRARTDQQIVALLTPGQRQQIERRPPQAPRRPPRPQ
jgi:periplasmic protein CpxP/Spy